MSLEDVAALLAAGRGPEALVRAQEGLPLHAGDSQWRHVLGASLHACGRSADALAELREAVRLDPANALAWNTLGAVLVEHGDPLQAQSALDEAIRLNPGSLEPRFNLALALRNRGEYGEARARLEEILARWPDNCAARFELAGALIALEQPAAALPHLEALLSQFPGHPQVLAHLAAAQAETGRADLASATCDKLLAMKQVPAGQLASAAYTLASVGRLADAAQAARKAIAMAPQSADVRSVAAGALVHAGFSAEGRHHYSAIAEYRPKLPSAWRKLGLAAMATREWPEAIRAFERLAELEPRDRGALLGLGGALSSAERREDAIAVFERALEAGHRDAAMLSALVHTQAQVCDWRELDARVAELRATALVPSDMPAQPQCAVYFETTAAEQRAWAQNWARNEYAPGPALFQPPEPRAGRRLRVGCLSSDFYNHATALLLAGLFEHLDRDRIELFAYSTAPDDGSAVRRRVAAAIEHFVDISELSGRAAAQRVAADRLDVLLDLGGYVRNSPFALLALRPAPVQGHFLGYPGTTGAPFVDFFIADAITVPDGGEANFTERVLRMPACYQPNDPGRGDAAVKPRAAFGVADDALVLCSFNQGVKIRAEAFARWCALLEALPGAVLWLSTNGEVPNARLHRVARDRGVDPARIVFAPYVAQDEHIARIATADIAIDTFPCTSHTTASDAAWAGVPLVTTYADTFASRVAASVLHAAGCGEWAFDDADRAFEATLALARDRGLREALRARLVASRRASPLFDVAAYARAFEALLEEAAVIR